MNKFLKLERVTGVVALSYLVLIPVGGYMVWTRVKQLEQDVDELFADRGVTVTRPPAIRMPNVSKMFKMQPVNDSN